MKLENINWEADTEMIDIQDIEETNYQEQDKLITFDFNGYKLTAVINFELDLVQRVEEETNFNETELFDATVVIEQIYDEDEINFSRTAKQEVEMEHFLKYDLKAQY